MKKAIVAFILILSVMLTLAHPFAENAQEEMCSIKWVTRGASFAVNKNPNVLYQVGYSEVPKGTVLTIDDLPDVRCDENKVNAKNCHAEWKDAVGSKIEEDSMFTLQWIANSPDEVAVTWNSYLKKISKADYCVKVTTFEKGHVLTKNDLPKLIFDDTDDYEFGWGEIVGTELSDNTFFDAKCTAKSPDMAALCYHLPQRECIFTENIPDDFDFTYDNEEETIVRLYSKGSTIDEMPEVLELIYAGSIEDTTGCFEFDFTGITAEDNLTNCYVQLPVLFIDVTFMLDENTVFKEYIHWNRAKKLTAPSCEEYAQAANLDDDYTLAVWERGIFPLKVNPSEDFSPPHERAIYYPFVLKYGDVTYDGTVDTRDAVILLKYCAGIWYSTLYKPVADANKDGIINTADAVTVLRNTIGME